MAGLAAVALILARNVRLGPRGPEPIDVRAARLALPVLAPEEARAHVGRRAVVCGLVVHAAFAAPVRGQPTFLNFGGAHPNQDFTVIIWGSNRPKFGRPEVRYLDREICVAGRVHQHRGVPRIEAVEPIQIEEAASGAVPRR